MLPGVVSLPCIPVRSCLTAEGTTPESHPQATPKGPLHGCLLGRGVYVLVVWPSFRAAGDVGWQNRRRPTAVGKCPRGGWVVNGCRLTGNRRHLSALAGALSGSTHRGVPCQWTVGGRLPL